MKVKDLIDILQDENPENEVVINLPMSEGAVVFNVDEQFVSEETVYLNPINHDWELADENEVDIAPGTKSKKVVIIQILK